MYHFFCTLENQNQRLKSPYVVLRVLETWFLSHPLYLTYKANGYPTTATLRTDQIKISPLPKGKDLKKEGKRYCCYWTDFFYHKMVWH